MDLKRAIEDEGIENSENGSKRVKMNSDDEEEEIDFSDDELLVPILPTEIEVKLEPNEDANFEIEKIQSESEESTVNFADERIIDEAEIKEEFIEEIELDEDLDESEEEMKEEGTWQSIRNGRTTWPCSQCGQLVSIQPFPGRFGNYVNNGIRNRPLVYPANTRNVPRSARKRPTLLGGKLDGTNLLAQYNMLKHQLSHNHAYHATYKCTACPFKAPSFVMLKKHYANRLESNTDSCAYAAQRLHTLRQSCTETQATEQKFTYECGHCEWRKTSRSKTTLTEHLMSEHVKKERIKCSFASAFGDTCHATKSEIVSEFGLAKNFDRILREHHYRHAINEIGQLLIANTIYFGATRKCTRYCNECFAFFATPSAANKHANKHHKYLSPGAPFTSRVNVTRIETALSQFNNDFGVYMNLEFPGSNKTTSSFKSKRLTEQVKTPTFVKTSSFDSTFDSRLNTWFCDICSFSSAKKWPMNRHMQKEHGIGGKTRGKIEEKKTKKNEKTIIPVVCVECHAQFLDEKYLSAHNCDGVLINKRAQ